MKKIGVMGEVQGTAGAFTMIVAEGKDAPVGAEVFVAEQGEGNDSIRFNALVTALGQKDVAFMALLSQFCPKISTPDEVRIGIDMTIQKLKEVR